MAHEHLLCPFLTAFVLLPIIMMISTPTSQAFAHDAIFSEPIQILYGGESLTDGELTLNLDLDCSLTIQNAGVIVEDFNTSVSTSHCGLLVNSDGQLVLVPDDESTTTNIIGEKSFPGEYALLFIDGKLGIFGPAMWSNGVGKLGYYANKKNKDLITRPHPKLRTGHTDYLLLSPNNVTGSANANVVLAENGLMTAAIAPRCCISVFLDESILVWSSDVSDVDMECVLQLKSNGELVMMAFDDSGSPYVHWSGGFPDGENLYVSLLRYNGEIVIYGLKTWLYNGSSSSSSLSSVAAEKIKMVTSTAA